MLNFKKGCLTVLTGIAVLGISFQVSAADVTVKTQSAPQPNLLQIRRELSKQETFALLWMRSSAEYRALCYQGYNIAAAAVDDAIAKKKPGDKPLAIILDCDETVVDNTRSMAMSALRGNSYYDAPWWRATCKSGQSKAMPGAVEFLKDVHKKGVEIFYVTGRAAKYSQKETTKNLQDLGFPTVDEKHLLMYTDNSDKQPRFDAVAAKYNVAIYMGDNIGDLPLFIKGKNLSERQTIIDKNKASFGTKFIMFPNPIYGSWVSALAKGYMKLPNAERAIVNRKILSK